MTFNQTPDPEQLVSIGGTGEGCPVCDTLRGFETDRAAIEHISTHSVGELAFSLLYYKAFVQRICVEMDAPGGVASDEEFDDINKQVSMIANESPLRPPGMHL